MKLYFIVDYTYSEGDDDCIQTNTAKNNLIGSTHSNRNNMIHPHENYVDFSHFVKFRIFRDQMRYSYKSYEHQLVEIPDELVFQYMMIGLRDNDFILYNVHTKRIVMSNDPYDCKEYANSLTNSGHNISYPKAAHGQGSYSSNAMFDFNRYDDVDEQREDILVEFDTSNGYSEMLEVLMPYVYNMYIRETKILCDFLSEHPGIGKNTMNMSSESPIGEEESASCYNNNIKIVRRAVIPGNSVSFIFESFMHDHELWCKTQDKYTTYEKEMLRIYSLDILTKFKEHTGVEEWDVRR